MMFKGFLTTGLLAAGLTAVLGACSIKEERVVTPAPAAVPAAVPVASASDTCISQGYVSGTPAYDACVARLARR